MSGLSYSGYGETAKAMISIKILVVDGEVYLKFPNSVGKDDLLQEFSFENDHRVYKLKDDSDIRIYLEEEGYPYMVYVGSHSSPPSRIWKPDSEESLTNVAGVSKQKSENLRRAGFATVDDIRFRSQADLSEIQGISNALAARIKADTGDIH